MKVYNDVKLCKVVEFYLLYFLGVRFGLSKRKLECQKTVRAKFV